MKNRTLRPWPANGKFFCWHKWKVSEQMLGYDWDIMIGVELLGECTKCGKNAMKPNYCFDEVPDEYLLSGLRYL